MRSLALDGEISVQAGTGWEKGIYTGHKNEWLCSGQHASLITKTEPGIPCSISTINWESCAFKSYGIQE